MAALPTRGMFQISAHRKKIKNKQKKKNLETAAEIVIRACKN
jgi:hypothetical protein